MKWKTDRTQTTSARGARSGVKNETPPTGVFRPLGDYRQSWSSPTDVTVSGVFRPLSEDGPSIQYLPSATKNIYTPSPDTIQVESKKHSRSSGTRTPSSELSYKIKLSSDRDSGIGKVTDISVSSEGDRILKDSDKRDVSKVSGIKEEANLKDDKSSDIVTEHSNKMRHSKSKDSIIINVRNREENVGSDVELYAQVLKTKHENKSFNSINTDSKTHSLTDNSGEGDDRCTQLSKRVDIKKSDSSSSKRATQGDPSGERSQQAFRSSITNSETFADNRSTYSKLESSSAELHDSSRLGMHPAARDTGQQRGFPLSSVSHLSRASSPGTNSSSGSSFNLSSATDTSGEKGLRETPMGSTTGLLVDNSSSTSQSKLKVDSGCMPGLSATLTILSLAASLGNVLRLPRVVYFSGGGTFLIVYICISLVFGIPLVFLEIGLGQFCQEGTTKLWRAVPLFKGVGYVKVLASGLLSIYYPVLMALSLFYMLWCIKGPMPFEECEFFTKSITGEQCLKLTFLKSVTEDAMWFGVSVAFLFLLWTLFMLCIFKSEHSYRTSIFFILTPVVVCLVALFVESILNDPSVYGLQKLVSFQWDNLLDIKIWYFATIQMFFSTHLGFGNIVTCAGRLYSKNNALWAAISYVVSNLVIGILTVCIVYQWIGQENLGDPNNVEIQESFIYALIYDVAVHHMDQKQLWSALTFLVIICTGFAAMISVLYTVLVAVTLEISKRWSWSTIAGCFCIIGFLVGLVIIIPNNMDVVHILDHYVIGRMVLASTALELIGFSWIYGSSTLYNDFEFVLGRKLNPIWKITWMVTPVLLIIIEICSMIFLPLTGFPGKASDPVWMYCTGWIIYLITWIIIITAAIRQIYEQVDYNLAQKFKSTLKPSRNWGPVDTIYRHWWVQWRVACTKTGQRDFTFKRRGTKDYTSSVQKYKTKGPVGTYRTTPSSTNGTLQHNRATDRGPFTIQTNGDIPEHVCWRGTLQHQDGT